VVSCKLHYYVLTQSPVVLNMTNSCCVHIVAVVVYFTYGIHNSKLNDAVSRVKYKQLDEVTDDFLHEDSDDTDDVQY